MERRTNRGGVLLKEEKFRKQAEKDLPRVCCACRREYMSNVNMSVSIVSVIVSSFNVKDLN
jgi:hypothetical protein